MRYIYEIIIRLDEDQYVLDAPDLPGCFTWGKSIEDVLHKAPDALETHVGSYLANGENVPVASFGHLVNKDEVLAIISFEASAASVGAPHIAAKHAAERLDVSKGRVSQLLKEKRLEGYRSGRDVMISIASIERLAAIPRRAGRPRKDLTTV